MKRKPTKKPEASSIGLFELVLPAVPFLSLIPNFYIIPDLSYQGLATQELSLAAGVAVILALAIVVLFRRKKPFRINREYTMLLVALGAFLLWQAVSLLWAPDWTEGVRILGIWFCLAVLVTTGLFGLSSRSAEWLYYSMAVVILILAGSQFLEYWMYEGVMFGVFFNHGITTELMALVLPLQLVIFISTPKRTLLVLSALSLCAGAAATLLTLRRGAMLGLGIAMLLIAVSLAMRLLRAHDRIRLVVVGVALLIGIGGVLLFKREQLITRIRSAVTIQVAKGGIAGEYGLTSRMTKWITAWEAAKDNLLAGVGAGGFPARYGDYRRNFVENPRYAKWAAASEPEDYDEIRNPHAHGEFLQVLAELGIIGLSLLLAFSGLIARTMWRARAGDERAWVLGALYGLAAFVVSSAISGFSLRFAPPAILSACVVSLGLAKARASETRADEQTAGWQLSRIGVLVGVTLLLAFAILLVVRADSVLEGQKAHSLVDFRFNPESPSFNETLLRRYDQALSADSANAGAHLGRALLLFQMKRPDEAAPYAEYALKHNYSRPFTPVLLSFIYEQMNDLERASAVLSECLKSFPKSIAVHAAYAEILEKQGKKDHAEGERSQAVNHGGRIGKSWMLALKMKEPAAKEEARRQNLIEPALLQPMLMRSIFLARSHHYLRQ